MSVRKSRPGVFVVGALRPPPAGPAPAPGPLRRPRLLALLGALRPPTGLLNLALPARPARRLRLADVIDLDDGQEWWDAWAVAKHHAMAAGASRGRIDAMLRSHGPSVATAVRRTRGGAVRLEVRSDGVAGRLRTPRGGSAKQIVAAAGAGRLRMRWMSPREYGRLQGAGDFPLAGTRNQQLFGFADAVCVPAVRWIDERVLTPLYESGEADPGNGRSVRRRP
jgi:DNA (cytosine-5)-methyltransferase 1